MGIWTIDDSKWAYCLDFALYGCAVLGLATLLTPAGLQGPVVAYTAGGLVLWTGAEYLLHRFVLHGVQPFVRWHAAHHERPTAWICSSTLLSASLMIVVVFVPALVLWGLWRAIALTLGMSGGYVLYATMHHALHHWRLPGAWLRQRKLWHARHHHSGNAVCFGVTTALWDRVFGTGYRGGR